jgi:AcrR family transcriptional regulator
MPQPTRANDVPTQIKNPALVERRRRQIVDAAAKLFIEKGFHKTTTREIAAAAGVSIGTLYEYINSKEDVLYLVCESIHAEVQRRVEKALHRASGGRELLAEVIREYFLVCDRMSDFILLVYQETHSLPEQWKKRVLENDLRITGILLKVLVEVGGSADCPEVDANAIELFAHNITVLGHMWTFRRWFLARHYSIEDYTAQQINLLLGSAAG